MQTVSSMQQARIAIRAGRLSEARRLMRQHVHDDPQNHVAWLLLARATPSPKAAMEYVQRAEALQPESPLVQRELQRLGKKSSTGSGNLRRMPWGKTIFLSSSLIVLMLLVVWLAPLGWNRVAALKEAGNTSLAAAPITITPITTHSQVVLLVTEEPPLQPTPTRRPVEEGVTSEDIADEAAVEVPEIAEPAVEESNGIRPYGVGSAEHWIDVDLNTQTLVAYEGDTPVFNSLISSGMWDTPTITGQFRTQVKYESQDMNGYAIGYDYYLEDVPYVMYFFGNFAIHGTYLHNNFGTPMSHGCVNMNPVDAGWLFNWAPVGTTVNVHE